MCLSPLIAIQPSPRFASDRTRYARATYAHLVEPVLPLTQPLPIRNHRTGGFLIGAAVDLLEIY